jgi:hypothetical protein
MELAVKLEAALVKYFQSLNPSPYPAYFNKTEQVRPGEADEDLEAQYLRCRAADQAEEEYPLDSGNFWWPCEVELRTPAQVQTAAEAASDDPADSTKARAKHQALATILEDAVLVDDLAEQLNTAAAALGAGYELTVFAVQSRAPARSQGDEVYSSGWTFRVYCCSRTF